MIINVPIHPISLKILLSSYAVTEQNAIKVLREDILFNVLVFFYKNDKSYKKYMSLLTSQVAFDLPNKLGSKVHHLQAGYFLYKLHKKYWMQFIHARVTKGQEARAALHDFAELYQIDVDDIDFDNVYRSWTRYKNILKNTASALKKPSEYVLPPSSSMQSLSEEELYLTAHQLVSDHIDLFLQKNNSLHFYGYRQLVIYLMYTYQDKTLQEIAAYFDCSFQNIAQILDTFRGKIYKKPQFLAAIEQLAA